MRKTEECEEKRSWLKTPWQSIRDYFWVESDVRWISNAERWTDITELLNLKCTKIKKELMW